MFDEPKLKRAIDRLGRLSITVIGDLFLDKYLDIDARLTEPSVETGLDAYQVTGIRNRPGAAGTVLNNLAALGVGRLLVVSVIGEDGEGFELKGQLQRRGVELSGITEAPNRFTPTYTKPMMDDGTGPPRELNRLDIKNRTPLPKKWEAAVIGHLEQAFKQADGVIVADQVEQPDCGVLTSSVRQRLAELADEHPDKIVLADSRAHIGRFRNVCAKPNFAECVRAVEPSAPPSAPVLETARRCAGELARRTGRPVYCTLGSDGILYTDGQTFAHVPGYPVEGPVDIVGAGDATTAGIVSGLCTGLSPTMAAALGNLVASITVQQLGTTGTATPAQVLARWREVSG